MQIDASTYPTFADAIAVAETVKYTTGSTLYLPGNVVAYDGDGLTLPHNTQMYGDGGTSHISGRMNIGSVLGMQKISTIRFEDGLNVQDARNTLFEALTFQGTVTFAGASYYNTFNTCRWICGESCWRNSAKYSPVTTRLSCSLRSSPALSSSA